MIDAVLEELINRQRPYYLLEGNSIKGLENQYWLVFKHRDGENIINNIVTFLGMIQDHDSYKILRINPQQAEVTEYVPRQSGNIPSVTLFRTGKLDTIEHFLLKRSTNQEKSLLAGSFLEINDFRRKFNLPDDLQSYNKFIIESLKRTHIYRRSTAYFDSGILKVYEEPLQHIIQRNGKIHLLMDWQGFTKQQDITILSQLENPDYRQQYTKNTLEEFLHGLQESQFNSTEILAELVRLDFLKIKLIKMASERAIYHKKTGILSDSNGNHIYHEGSDNFTYAAHSRNAESITFLYSWDRIDSEEINRSIQQFDTEWQRNDIAFDISEEFLQQVITERNRRRQLSAPQIEEINPDDFPAGETTEVEITGKNLDKVESLSFPDNDLVTISIQEKESTIIKAAITVDSNHPPRTFSSLKVKTTTGEYHSEPITPPQVSQELTIPEFEEIIGFKEAIATIITGKNGTPSDFLYWLAKQRPQQFKVASSDELDRLFEDDILFEHQKSGAQHCHRVMRDFGMTVCADAVGLGKTRLAAAVGCLYRQVNPHARIAIIAAKKLHANWEREMTQVGFHEGDYELYNKNLMSRKQSNFLTDFTRYGGADLVIIDEAHEGIRNYASRVHKTCLQIKEKDLTTGKKRHFLLLTATPWNNRREDIYNILFPFITRPEGFKDLGLPPQISHWFANRETGKELFTDDTSVFRQVYRELFLQRTRQMLRDATPDLDLYAPRQAEWLPVTFETFTEQALEEIFTQFEDNLYIPFVDPLRYLNKEAERRLPSAPPQGGSLLSNQRLFFLQRAESSMYALSRTLNNFANKIRKLQEILGKLPASAQGLREFLLIHYGLNSKRRQSKPEIEESEFEDEDEDEENDQEKRAKTKRSIITYTEELENNPEKAKAIYHRILNDCQSDLSLLIKIQKLLAVEFVKDHKKETVTQKVKELVNQGKKVLLISTFSDTVIDYYHYMSKDSLIASQGIGMAVGATKFYYQNGNVIEIQPHNISKNGKEQTGLKREALFKLFAPFASCRHPHEHPSIEKTINVLIGSETLSVGQNLQDADYLINIDLPWNPMILEQRIGRIDRPKQHKAEGIFIYYANSESQLLRQASRLNNLHKKLVGNIMTESGAIPTVKSPDSLGASIYGDTLFDDEVLPGYIDFLTSLVKVRKMEQGNLQEGVYHKHETNRELYTHTEILHSEEVSRLLSRLGENYQANPIALGRMGDHDEPIGLVVLDVDYFDINGKIIPQKKQVLFWNDKTGEKNGYGVAIATGFKTPEAGDIFSTKHLLNISKKIYESLKEIKKQLIEDLGESDSLENIQITSERLTSIQNRITSLEIMPEGIDKTKIKNTLKKLSSNKETRLVQKLLKEFTDGDKSGLELTEYVSQLVFATNRLNLIDFQQAKPASLNVAIAGIMLRA